MVEINSNLQVNNVEAWQGSFGTGAGHTPVPRKPKDEDAEDKDRKPPKTQGVTKDDDGVIHVDVVA